MSSLSISRSLNLYKNSLFSSRFFSSSRTSKQLAAAKITNSKSTLINFSLSDSDSDENPDELNNKTPRQIEKPKLPPPYNPFNKTKSSNEITEPKDPKNLQEIFHNMRKDGLMQNAVKMFDALSKDGLTHEALQLFGEIKDKGEMPEVIPHTAVIETYMNAGQMKEGLKVYLGMLSSGILPNAYTYTVLIKGLANGGAGSKFLGDAKKYVFEMIEKGMRPNGGTCVALIEGFVKEEREDEAREMVKEMKRRGFVANEKGIREALNGKRGHVFRFVMDVFFGK